MRQLLIGLMMIGFMAGITGGAAAMAQSNATTQEIKGLGALTCKDFMDTFEGGNREVQTILAIAVISWVQGYASAVNLENDSSAYRDLTTMDDEYTADRVESLCMQNPNAYIVAVARAIYEEMPLSNQTGV